MDAVLREARRVERGEVRVRVVVGVHEGGPGRIDDEAAKDDDVDERLDPPGVYALHALTDPAHAGRRRHRSETLGRGTLGGKDIDGTASIAVGYRERWSSSSCATS